MLDHSTKMAGPVVVEGSASGGEEEYMEADAVLRTMISRIREVQDDRVQSAVAWAEKVMWGE